MVQAEPDERYREQWPTATTDPDREQRVPERRIALLKRLVLGLFALLPWLLYCGLVFTAWWLIIFDGDSSADGLGWGLLALAPSVLVRRRPGVEVAASLDTRALRAGAVDAPPVGGWRPA